MNWTTYIAGSGYRVQGAGTLHEAEILLAEPFDLLILDINLPDGSGMELCRRLRPHIRAGIIICTGRSERSLRISGLKDGADAYLVKPVDPEELEATLASVASRRRRRSAVFVGRHATACALAPRQLAANAADAHRSRHCSDG